MKQIAVIGSGIVGSIMAHLLVSQGFEVTVFEKGPDYPYPYTQQFLDSMRNWQNPAYDLPGTLKGMTQSGDYRGFGPINAERVFLVGGQAARWGAMADRMAPADFHLRSKYGIAEDWPITYQDLEGSYAAAEDLLGVSGSDDGDPFAPPRSRPFPLPPFELTYDIRRISERLKQSGLYLRTSPQARARAPYDSRPACLNYGACDYCPIGARYSPRHHLDRAIATGRCVLRTNTSVRRLVSDQRSRVRALVYRDSNGVTDSEHVADAFVVAAGTIESSRLLLLSRSNAYPDGIGNGSGQVGKFLLFTHVWDAHAHYDEDLYPSRTGPEMGQSRQFIDPETRATHGGILVQFRSNYAEYMHKELSDEGITATDLVDRMRALPRCESIVLHGEGSVSPEKYIGLSNKKDRFGDPFAHVHYASSAYDAETYAFATRLLTRFANGSGAQTSAIRGAAEFNNGFHHMGGCRMGAGPANGVVDSYCKVFGTENLYVVGGSNFVANTPVHPTLTMAALGVRAAQHLNENFR